MKKSRPGGRSARVVEATLASAREIMAEGGLEGFTIPAVAAHAGVNPTSIYRRWSTREALAVAAWLDHAQNELPLPDTGALQSDLAAFASALRTMLETPQSRAVLRLLAAADPALEGPRKDFWSARFADASRLVERAAARGEITAGTDPGLLIELMVAPLYMRLLATGAPLEDFAITEAAAILSRGIRERQARSGP